ncbi:hypothetical protein FOZ61_002542, partial [Perkinsus olseni]
LRSSELTHPISLIAIDGKGTIRAAWRSPTGKFRLPCLPERKLRSWPRRAAQPASQ